MVGIKVSGQSESTCERSRFIGYIYPLNRLEDVKSLRQTLTKQYHGASHFPYAYIFDDQMHYDDDGEPTGTAGAPLLNLLKSAQLNRALLIIVRFFGGKKLGTKRLRDSFTFTGQATIDSCVCGPLVSQTTLTIEGPLEQIGNMHRFVLETCARIENITYNKLITAILIFSEFDINIFNRQLPDWVIVNHSTRLVVI